MSWSRLAKNGRQRGVVLFDDLDVPGETGLRQPFHVVQHYVNIDRLAFDRPLVGKDFHAVDQLHDAVGLVADQLGERPVVVAGRLFEQLCRAANSGQRILDLMRQHGSERDD